MKHDQLVILSVFRDMNSADFCVVTPRGRLSLCALKFSRTGSNRTVLSVDICDENGEVEKRKVDQEFLLRLFAFIEDRIFKEFHSTDARSIHSLEVAWRGMGLKMIKYYDKQVDTFFQMQPSAPVSLRVN